MVLFASSISYGQLTQSNPLLFNNGGSFNDYTRPQIAFGWYYNQRYAHRISSRHHSSNDTYNAIDFYLWHYGQSSTALGDKHVMSLTCNGVGIGTKNPGADLALYKNINRGFKFWNDLNISYVANITQFETFGTRSGVLQFYQPFFANGEEPLGGWTQLRCGGIYIIYQPTSSYPGRAVTEIQNGDIRLYDKEASCGSGYDCYNIWLKNNGDAKFRGKIEAGEIEVKVVTWPDIVFSNNYNLRSLNEVEEFIKINNHLPEVPSEDEVLESGVNLGEMNALLLKKIEELTLYMIEQQKEIEALQSEFQSLK